MAKHIYAIRGERVLDLKTTLVGMDGDKPKRFPIAFKNNRFETEDDEIAELMDAALAVGAGLSTFCHKVDSAAAEALVRSRLASAAKGGLTAGLVSSLENQARNAAQAELDALTSTLDATDEIAVTEQVDLQTDVDSSLVGDAKPAEGAESDKTAEVVAQPVVKSVLKLGG